MIIQQIALYNHNLGVLLIGIFVLVVIALTAIPILLMKGDKKKKEE